MLSCYGLHLQIGFMGQIVAVIISQSVCKVGEWFTSPREVIVIRFSILNLYYFFPVMSCKVS